MDGFNLLVSAIILWRVLVLESRLSKKPKPKPKEQTTHVPKLKDLGGMVAPIPEVDPKLIERMKTYYTNGGEMKFAEKFIMSKFGATQVQAQAVKALWQRDGILMIKNPAAENSTHVLASYRKLRKL